MEQSLSSAFTLLTVGMITVFLILGLVVLAGQVLIRLVNRFFKDIKEEVSEDQYDSISKEHMAVISAVISEVTSVPVKSVKIEKI